MKHLCFFNGAFVDKSELMVNITDLAMNRAYGVFDYLRTYNGIPFRIEDYLKRFESSAGAMNLQLPYSVAELKPLMKELISRNDYALMPLAEMGIRLLLTGGYATDGYSVVKPNFFMLAEDQPIYPEWQFTKGIRLHTHEHQRELPRVKTINYLTAIKLASVRQELNVQDTLYHSNGNILECTRNNFFLFHNDVLVTPADDMLCGITRKVVLELAQKKFKLELRKLRISELDNCTEAFITGSTHGICPVAEIDGKRIGKGAPGPNTQMLMAQWKEYCQSYQ